MAHKHELMAKLQAARQTSAKVVEAECQKAYPSAGNQQLSLLHLVDDLQTKDTIPSPPEDVPSTVAHSSESIPPDTEAEMEGEPLKKIEKIAYTTISVPKPYGQKAKLYATLLSVNMVEFTCGALDAYILQLQELGKLPRVDL